MGRRQNGLSLATALSSAFQPSSAYVDILIPSAYADIMSDLMKLAQLAEGSNPSQGLAAVAALRRLLERVEGLHVSSARTQGWSWQQIADSLGVTKQTVHRKYARRK